MVGRIKDMHDSDQTGFLDVNKNWDGKHTEGSSTSPTSLVGWKKQNLKMLKY